MHNSKEELYELIKDLITKKEFEKEINKRFIECDKLLNEETIALLIVDEFGRNAQVVAKISDLNPNSDYTIIGKITSIYDSKTFKRKADLLASENLCYSLFWDIAICDAPRADYFAAG